MKAELKYIHSPDALDLANFIPAIENNFCLLLQLHVAPLAHRGEETFDIMLCTPQWLVDNHALNDIIIGRGYLMVLEYNYQRIYHKLKSWIEKIEGVHWEDVALKINQIARWEFEDYRDS